MRQPLPFAVLMFYVVTEAAIEGQSCSKPSDCSSTGEILCLDQQCKRPRCSRDSDCPTEFNSKCVEKQCVLLGECESDKDCPLLPHTSCKDFNCVKQERRCSTQADCSSAEDYFCISRWCRKLGQSCRKDFDCPYSPKTSCINSKCVIRAKCNMENGDRDCKNYPGTFCVGSTCISLGQSCTADEQCPSSTVCLKNKCVKLQKCHTDSDCPQYPQTFCLNSICVKQPSSCTQDRQCPSSMACLNSKCVQVLQPCTTDTECPHYPSTACIKSRCQKIYKECKKNRDCPFYPLVQCSYGICTKMGGKKLGEKCCRDEQCEAFPNQECTNQKCQEVPSAYYGCGTYPPRENVNSKCVKVRKCLENVDCPFYPQYVCHGGQCARNDSRCSIEEANPCQHDSYVKSGSCIKSKCMTMGLPCRDHADCPNCPETLCWSNVCVKTPYFTVYGAGANIQMRAPVATFVNVTTPVKVGKRSACAKQSYNFNACFENVYRVSFASVVTYVLPVNWSTCCWYEKGDHQTLTPSGTLAVFRLRRSSKCPPRRDTQYPDSC